MPLSEIKSYVVVLSFYIKMIKRRTLQVSSSKHSIKKDMLFSLVQIEIILVGQGGVLPAPPPLGYAPENTVLKTIKVLQHFYNKISTCTESTK